MKKRFFYFIGILILGLVLLLVKPTQAGWIIKMKSKTEYEVNRSVIYIQDNQLRIVEDNQTFIFNGNNGEICFIDVPKESYWKGNIDDFKKAMTEFQQQMMHEASAQMKLQMENMTAEQKAMMEEAMKKMKDFENPGMPEKHSQNWDIQINRTHEMGNIAGYPARKYLVKVDGELKEEVWLAENMIAKKDWDPEIFKKFFESLSGGAHVDYESTDEYWAFEKKGMPLKTITFDGEYQQEEVAEEIIEKVISKQMFLPPLTYSKVTLDEIMKGMNKE